MLTPGNNFRSEWKRERAKLKGMTFLQKLSYLFTYYKHIFVILLILIAVGYYIGDAIVQNSKETVLEGFFTNDEWDLFHSSQLESDYRDYFQLDSSQTIYFDDSLYIDLDGQATEYTAASNSKVMAYLANKELDFMVTTREVFEYYSTSLPMVDLRELLPADLLDSLGDALVYITPGDSSEAGAYALDLTDCRYVTGVGADQEPLVTDTYYLLIPQIAPHKEAVVEYIRYLFDWR